MAEFAKSLLLVLLFVSWSFLTQPAVGQSTKKFAPNVYHLSPSADLQYRLQELLIRAVPGDVIEFSEGRFELTRQLDIATNNITLRGQGIDTTTLSFKGQQSGGQGIEATGNNFLIEQLAIEDTAGNAIKVNGARNVTFRNIRTEWTGEAKSSNGAYGIYPVQCSNVLIEGCVAIGASDSGIYVGQSKGVEVRYCRAERNVAGIEIENTIDASVHDNVAINNAGGLLVFDLPGLQQKEGRNIRLFNNEVVGNNHKNFASPGNIVAMVPAGTGVMIMATKQVELFDNDIKNNETTNVAIVSYLISGKKVTDKSYSPISEAVSIHDNRISSGGAHPKGMLGTLLGPALGGSLPDILFDGVIDSQKLINGSLPDSLRHSILNNGDATFADFKLVDLSPDKILSGKYRPSRDLAPYSAIQPSLKVPELRPHDPPTATADPAAIAYRSAPEKLSEFGLFDGNGATQQPAQGVLPYTLNTTLFSDFTTKYRFIRIPTGESIRFVEHGPLEFPVGTVIAKTFAYPIDGTNPSKGQRLLETRIEQRQEEGWFGFSYRWNEEQTEATLLLGGGELNAEWIHSDGRKMSTKYEIPNPNQCLNCHSQNKAYVPIGPTAMNMNCDYVFRGGRANQLEHYARVGQLEKLPAAEKRARMPVAEDPATGSLDQRAHAWLHVNCAHCHNPFGTARTSGLDLRFDQSDPSKFGVWKSPVAAGHGSGGLEYDIVPGEPSKSILLHRMKSRDPSIRMPNVARNMVPDEAVTLVEQWIAAMGKDK